jgi:radical SAM superfamily enzyme YgiQ (UPF0313 family)
MRVAVIDANYRHAKFYGLAATWLRWEAQRAGVDIVPVESADIALVTVSSQQGVADVRRVRKTIPCGVPVVLGGGGAWGPAIFRGLCDCVCVGEGQRFVRTLFSEGEKAARELPECWNWNDTRHVIPGTIFPWDVPPLRHPDGTVRVFGARGCQRKCLFCQTGWEQKYQQNPNPGIVKAQIASLKRAGHKVAVITNDGAADDYDGVIGQQEFVSATVDKLLAKPITRSWAKSIRVGVEGVSERLRRAVGKPVTNADLAALTLRAWSNGVGVRWFFIAGLPGETDADWAELRELVNMIRHASKGVVMANFHAFIPQPASPLCVLPLRDEYWERFEEFRRWFFHGPGFTRRMQIVAPAGYKGRMERACESMAANEDELRRGWMDHENVNWRIRYLLTPDQMRALSRRYMDALGRLDIGTASAALTGGETVDHA